MSYHVFWSRIAACLCAVMLLYAWNSAGIQAQTVKKTTTKKEDVKKSSDPFRKDKVEEKKVDKEIPNHFQSVLEKEIVLPKPKSRFASKNRPAKTNSATSDSWESDSDGWGDQGNGGDADDWGDDGWGASDSANGEVWGDSDDVFGAGSNQTQMSGGNPFQMGTGIGVGMGMGTSDPQAAFSRYVARGIASIFKKPSRETH